MEKVEGVHRRLKIPQSCEADPDDGADNLFHNFGSEFETHRSYKKEEASLSIHINKA